MYFKKLSQVVPSTSINKSFPIRTDNVLKVNEINRQEALTPQSFYIEKATCICQFFGKTTFFLN